MEINNTPDYNISSVVFVQVVKLDLGYGAEFIEWLSKDKCLHQIDMRNLNFEGKCKCVCFHKNGG